MRIIEKIRGWPHASVINVSLLAFFFLGMLVPWEDLYRFFFFAGVVPLTVWSFFKGEIPPAATSPVILLLLLLTAYLALNSFFVGDAAFRMAFRRFRWGITVFILAGALLIACRQWIRRPGFYGRLFLGAVIVSGTAMMIPYLMAGDFGDRIAGVGLLWHTIQASSILLVVWTMGFVMICMAKDLRHADLVLLLAAFAVVMAVIVLSQSRGPLMAAGVTMLLASVSLILWLPREKRFMAAGVMGGAGLAAGLGLWSGRALLSGYMDALLTRGLSYRPEIWKAVIEHSSSHRLFGIGPATRLPDSPAGKVLLEDTGLVFAHTHNLFLEMFYAGGVIALLMLVAALVLLFCRLFFMHAPAGVRMACVCLLMVVLMVNFTDTVSPLSAPRPAWVLFWLPLVFLVSASHPETVKRPHKDFSGQCAKSVLS